MGITHICIGGRALRRLLGPAAAMLAIACEDSPLAPEPHGVQPTQPAGEVIEASSDARWADGYVRASNPTSTKYTPSASHSYNRAGGPITIIRPAGTTGRYVVTFSGLSAKLGTSSTVKVSGFGSDNSYCKPVTGYLVSDKVEVRCYRGGTGSPVNAAFTLLVTGPGRYQNHFFAYAHQPTATDYAPQAQGSWNPGGPIRIRRLSVGYYSVTFPTIGYPIAGGHAQVTAVGSGKAYCSFGEEGTWGGTSDLYFEVSCFTPAGAPVDSKFSLLFFTPDDHMAFAYADQPFTATYSPPPAYSSNPAGGAISITRSGVGKYDIWWVGVDAEILGAGNVQVTAMGSAKAQQCKVKGQGPERAQVQCFAPNGTLVDSYFTVLLGS
jgi:hypothetical protein